MMGILKKLFTLIIFLLISLLITTCDNKKDGDDDPVGPGDGGETATVVVGSNEFGTVETESGYGITVVPGAVPRNREGEAADVTFSIETDVESPAPLLGGATLSGDVTRLGPEGFYFSWPVRTTYPFSESADVSELYLAHYDALEESWRLVPKSDVDMSNRTISGDALELGYYAIVKMSAPLGKTEVDWADGGFEYYGESGYYYTLTVAAVSNFKYPNQANWYGNRIVGSTGSSGSTPTGGPLQPTHIHLPQATYQVWISRTKPGTISTPPVKETYTVAATGTISQPVTYSGPLSNGSGWATLSFPGGGTWVEGGPEGWPTPTSTYGTGEFQATLTWVNASGRIADIDLHLYGPNDLHIYYDNISSASFELDEDWISRVGNAVENIYSTSTIPSGSYDVYINLFGFRDNISSINYSTRVIYGNDVKTKTGSLSEENSDNDKSKMVKVYSFNK